VMRFNLRRGLVVQLSLCLGIVLLLAFVASVAPAGAQTTNCVTQCTACQVNPDQTTWKTETVPRCSPICRIFYNGQMTTVYGCYSQVCTIKPVAKLCTPKTLCENNGCESGTPYWDPDQCIPNTVVSCGSWTQIGVSYGNCISCPSTN
jgi:hypothetical protein